MQKLNFKLKKLELIKTAPLLESSGFDSGKRLLSLLIVIIIINIIVVVLIIIIIIMIVNNNIFNDNNLNYYNR